MDRPRTAAARSYMSEMTEKIDLSKNTLMKPGHQYRLYIRAKDANGESVIGNRNYFATINWDKLIDPGFYVRDETGKQRTGTQHLGYPAGSEQGICGR